MNKRGEVMRWRGEVAHSSHNEGLVFAEDSAKNVVRTKRSIFSNKNCLAEIDRRIQRHSNDGSASISSGWDEQWQMILTVSHAIFGMFFCRCRRVYRRQ